MMDEGGGICGISLKQLRFLQIIENMLDSGLEELLDVYVHCAMSLTCSLPKQKSSNSQKLAFAIILMLMSMAFLLSIS